MALRREPEVIVPEGVDENWERIGQEVTEILEQTLIIGHNRYFGFAELKVQRSNDKRI